ncbi:MAG TPA: antibiotic biosynthesis monooxygenase [Thiotrichaceae bacterium]|jgi:quinol monooxygenase YgiN|nr:antibiotic biosynthesis monooxygenase [Thiotrichaceae bacterium]HIM08035.1 antibiotic biosynthesis monooxygenase [Gammaproteobacteria bacterium]
MSALALVELTVKPEARSTLLSILETMLPETRDYEGCIKLECHVNQENDCELVLVEYWETAEHHQKYAAWRTETGDMDKIAATLAEPPSIKHFDGVDV